MNILGLISQLIGIKTLRLTRETQRERESCKIIYEKRYSDSFLVNSNCSTYSNLKINEESDARDVWSLDCYNLKKKII